MAKATYRAHFDGEHVVLDEPARLAKGTPLVVIAGDNKVNGESLVREAEPRSRRVFSLLMGVGYIIFVAELIGDTTRWPFGAAFGVTVLGCLVVMASLALLGVKAYRKKDARRRFTFSTVFLASIPLSVYLAGARLLLRDTRLESFDPILLLLIAGFGVFGMTLSTIILMSFAEAIIWLAVACIPRQRT